MRRTTGLVLDPYFSATKLEWLFDRGRRPRRPTLAFGTVDSWLLWKLTGGAVHATDASNASRTMLFDIGTGAWSAELCELFGVPAPVPARGAPVQRPVRASPIADGPLGLAVPVSGIAGDQQAALFGQACFDPGMAKNTYGTGSSCS